MVIKAFSSILYLLLHGSLNNAYVLDQIETPPGLFKDGAPYSVCVTFAPISPEAGYITTENCQQFTNQKGDNPKVPFINLDAGVRFTNNQ